jgi:hypothetical protein
LRVGTDASPLTDSEGDPLGPESSALQREPQELAHQVANPVGATKVFLLMFDGFVFDLISVGMLAFWHS